MSDSEASGATGIAIIGISVRLPGARNIREFWQNLCNGVESISYFSDEELDSYMIDPSALSDPNYVKAGCVLEGVEMFDASFFDFNPREAEITDPQHRLFLECAWEALEDAGYDPAVHGDSTGVFAGTGMSTYLLLNLAANPTLFRKAGLFQITVGNDKDYLATRISYKLNLKGPSINVQTACSSSLVAVSLACQSLLDYQCDVALAGGVSIRLPQKAGYWYQEGGISSPDGHCRSFDAKAEGTVFGSGLGVVVLKRLEDALSDGDNIYAVIKGSAVNNDGSLKIGYTAPSVDGQANVIAEALAVAGVSAESLSYIEAHGTATPIGDPIEIAALQKVFDASTSKRRFCGIGSVKSNVGHMDTAAGVTGLIKTALALKHGLIPASLHFEKPNPQIDFENSAFYVNSKLTRWEANGTARRAGVSSFGIGGTNAHVILEEAPAVEPSGQSRPWQLLALSARTSAALDAATARLADYLRLHPDVSLADVAYTLQVGRRAFDHRRTVVCRDAGEAAAALETLDPQKVRTLSRKGPNPNVVFMFSGQGSQYVEMGLELYGAEPAFRKDVDRCSELLKPHLGFDLRDVLYPKGDNGDSAAERLQQTHVTQPAIFVIEYALARLWMKWGVRPEAMIGHSIGEYVAACIAGVFSLEDALALVAARGQLMQSLPSGLMLAVRLPDKELVPLLGARLSLAAVNGPSLCVVSGPVDAVAALEKKLDEANVDHRRLHTSHAFHSEMMGPVVEPFTRKVRGVNLKAPQVPYLSNVTGTWVTTEPTNADYWGTHLRRTVRFAEGLEELLKDKDRVLLEVGPGQTLSTLARQHPNKSADQVVLTSLSHPQQRQPEIRLMLDTLGSLWLAGAQIDWAEFYSGERRRRVSLPTYPFERQRYWIDAPKQRPAVQPDDASSPRNANGGGFSEQVGAAVGQSVSEEQAQAQPAAASAHSRPALANPYVAPRHEIEQTIAGIWQELLGINPVGIHDNFFELGGHSLLATHLVTRMHQALRIDIPLRSLFDTPTVATLAEAILRRRADMAESNDEAASSLPAIAPDPNNKFQPFPLTDVQQAYWIGRSGGLELSNVATHMYFELESDELDLGRFNRAWQRLIDRHDMLRDIVLPDGRQQILEPRTYEINVLDLRGRTDEDKAREADAVRQRMSHQVLPADRWPLFEITATRFDERRTRLHVSFDFLIGDARSLQILGRDLAVFYEKPDAVLPPLELSFRDYVLAQLSLESTQLYQRSMDYWMGRLATIPPAPDLPLARNPASLTRPRFARLSALLSREKWQRLKSRAAEAALTPSGVLVSAFAEVLAAWSNSPRFTINLTLFNRLPLHPQVNSIVGDFTSLTLLEVDNTEGDTFEARARRLQERLWEDMDHRYVSAVRVMRELARTQKWKPGAAMPVVFTSILNVGAAEQQNSGDESSGLGIAGDLNYSISQTPQVWIDHQVTETGGALSFNWDAVEDLFPESLLQDMFDAYVRLLHDLADSDACWHSRHLNLLPDYQIKLRSQVEAAQLPLSTALLHTLFEEQAAAGPERVAVISSRMRLTYSELNRRANRLAKTLRRMGAAPNKLVAVVMKKGWEQVVGALAVLKSGGAYLPVSADLPQRRVDELLEDGEVEVALTQGWVEQSLTWPEGVKVVAIDEHEPQDNEQQQGEWENLERAQGAEDLAYVIYTSGSTGKPKGVMIDHRGAVNTILDINDRFGVGASDRVLAVSSMSFDLSVYDVFGMLAAGGAVVMPESGSGRDPQRWAEQIREEKVTVWNSVPALMEMLVEYEEGRGEELGEGVRLVMLSGDWIAKSLPGRVRKVMRGAEVISLGGATEASIWSVMYRIGEVREEWKSIPYGRAMRNQEMGVVNHRGEGRPEWVSGEIVIGGVGVALGYWGDEQRSREKFEEVRECVEVEEKVEETKEVKGVEKGESVARVVKVKRRYKTGDKGRYLRDGNIEFLGREDTQVKVRGHRIELGEVEAAMEGIRGVKVAVVNAMGERQGEKRLVAYVVTEQENEPNPAELTSLLRQKLPDYMVPSIFVYLDALPLTSNGKVDRRALPPPGAARAEVSGAFAPPRNHDEEILTQVCAQVIGVERVGIYDNFFELGGNSILAIQFFHRLRDTLQIEMPLALLFESPTVAELSEQLEIGRREGHFTTTEVSAEVLKADAVLDSSIYPETPAEFIGDPASLLITGATGFLGAFLLSELLHQTRADVYCLVRASSQQQGGERIRKNLEAHSLWDETFAHRIIPVVGDLSQPLLGLAREQFDDLAGRIDVIYHNGGVVNYIYPYHRLKPANVVGTQEVLRLACSTKAKPVHFTSTIGIVSANTEPANGAGYEPDSVDYSQQLQGGYLQSKWVAERLVAEGRDRGLQITIHRPGTITGDSRTGSCNTDDFICRMIKGCIQLGIAPQMNGLMDLTPVDYVSRAIVHLSKQEESAGRAFHLVNPHSINYGEFVNWIRARGYALEVVPYTEWRAELSNLSERVKDNALFPLLPMFPQLDHAGQPDETPAEMRMPIERAASESRDPYSTFQNVLDMLEGSSVTCPLVDERLLDTYFSYLVRSEFLQPPPARDEAQAPSGGAPESASEQKAK